MHWDSPARPRHREPEPQLLNQMRRALRSDHPLDLLALAASLLTVTEPRTPTPPPWGSTPTTSPAWEASRPCWTLTSAPSRR